MKKFLNRCLLFFTPLLLGCICIEVALRKIPNDYTYKNSFLSAHSKELQVIFLGSSHVYRAVNPAYIGLNSFNASHVSQTIDIDLEILKKFGNDWEKLKYVVLALDYFTLFSNLETSKESWRLKNYYIYYDLPLTHQRIVNLSEILSIRFKTNLGRLYNYYIKGVSEIKISNKGWRINHDTKNFNNLEFSGERAAQNHHKINDINLQKNIETFDSIIKFTESKRIKVIIISYPASKAYLNNLNKDQLRSTINFGKSLARKYKNTTYVNYFDDSLLVRDDFYDANHLNGLGSKKFTLRIDSLISRLEEEN